MRIDLSAVHANIEAVSDYVGPDVDVMAVVKANAYGHGLIEISRAAAESGASCLGVATIAEGLSLRSADVSIPVVVLGASLPDRIPEAVRADLSLVVSSPEAAAAVVSAAEETGQSAKVHVKLDTGMGRVGIYPEDVADVFDVIGVSSHVEIEGLMTHVGWGADRVDDLHAQVASFSDLAARMTSDLSSVPRWIHAANSLVTVSDRTGHANLVRVGLLTYGIPPTTGSHPLSDQLRPALSIHARITQVRTLRPGQPVSYDGVTVVDRETRAGIVPIGYGDGYPRIPPGKGHVLLGGQVCPILGAVCMDQFVIDLSETDAKVGDEVVILGSSGDASITATAIADVSGRIPYEIVAGLTDRLPRIY